MGGQSSGYQTQGGYGQPSYGGGYGQQQYGGGFGQQYGGFGGGYGGQMNQSNPYQYNNFSSGYGQNFGGYNPFSMFAQPQVWGGWGQQWQQPGGGQIGASPANQSQMGTEQPGGMMPGGNMGPQRGIGGMRMRPGYESPGYVPPMSQELPISPGTSMQNDVMDYQTFPNKSFQLG